MRGRADAVRGVWTKSRVGAKPRAEVKSRARSRLRLRSRVGGG